MAEADAGRPPGGLFRQIGTVTLLSGLSQVAFLLANLLLGRHLDPSDFGRVDLAGKIINLTSFLGLFGLNLALVRAMPRQDLGRRAWPRVFRNAAVTLAGAALVTSLLAAWLYRFRPDQALAIGAASWSFGLGILGAALLGIERRFALSQLVQSLWRPLLFAGVAGLLALGRLRVDPVLWVYAGAGLLQLLWLSVALRATPRGTEPLPAGRLARDGLLFFGLFLTSTLMLRLDTFLVAGLIDTAALGRYAAAANIALTGYGVLSLGVGQVVTPRVAAGDSLRLRRLTRLLVLAGLGGGALLTLFGTPLIHWLYGGRYAGDFTLLMALFCLTGVVQVAYVVPSAWLGTRAPESALRFFLGVNVVSLALNVGLNLWLIPRFGLPGAAAATLGSWLWRLAWAAGLARRLHAAGRTATVEPPLTPI